jgi:hypothetical protein
MLCIKMVEFRFRVKALRTQRTQRTQFTLSVYGVHIKMLNTLETIQKEKNVLTKPFKTDLDRWKKWKLRKDFKIKKRTSKSINL